MNELIAFLSARDVGYVYFLIHHTCNLLGEHILYLIRTRYSPSETYILQKQIQSKGKSLISYLVTCYQVIGRNLPVVSNIISHWQAVE